MLLWHVRKQNYGFTLIEMIVTMIVVGVIAAIASPNLLGFLNQNRVVEATRQVEGALREAQKQAIRNGKQCTIKIDIANKAIINSTDAGETGCLLKNRFLKDSIQLNTSRNKITFSGKGNTDANDAVIVVSMDNGTNKRGCVAIKNSFGALRRGNYAAGTIPSPPVKASCQTIN